jgi:hypothetical protein
MRRFQVTQLKCRCLLQQHRGCSHHLYVYNCSYSCGSIAHYSTSHLPRAQLLSRMSTTTSTTKPKHSQSLRPVSTTATTNGSPVFSKRNSKKDLQGTTLDTTASFRSRTRRGSKDKKTTANNVAATSVESGKAVVNGSEKLNNQPQRSSLSAPQVTSLPVSLDEQRDNMAKSTKWKKPVPSAGARVDMMKKTHVEESEEGDIDDATPPRVAAMLQQVVEPIKHSLIKDIGGIVKKVTGVSGLRGFRLQERGSLFSPLIYHVSDADVQMYTKMQDVVSFAQCEHLIQFAKSHFYLSHIQSVRWESVDGSKVEVPFDKFNLSSSMQGRSGHAAFILTGIYHFSCGFFIPMDLALICGGQSSEPAQQRCEKIMSKVQEGDFAKVLQKIRALFKKGEARDSLVRSINNHIGKLRFIVKQLEMIKTILRISQSVENATAQGKQLDLMTQYLQRVLGLPAGVVTLSDIGPTSSLLAECECELQRRALTVIQSHHDVIAAKLMRATGDSSLDEFLFLDESRYYSERQT